MRTSRAVVCLAAALPALITQAPAASVSVVHDMVSRHHVLNVEHDLNICRDLATPSSSSPRATRLPSTLAADTTSPSSTWTSTPSTSTTRREAPGLLGRPKPPTSTRPQAMS